MVIPPDPEAITGEWLTAALRDSGAITGAAVVAVRRQRVGTGLVGQSVRFTLTYDHDEPGAPASVVGKFPSPEPVSRQTGIAGGIYEREVRFYQEIAATVAVRTPRCHVAAFDPATSNFVLLLEDLAPARQGDQIRGCTVAEAQLALGELAGLHAPHWGRAETGVFPWLPRPSAAGGGQRAVLYQMVWLRFLDTYREALPAGGIELGEQFGQALSTWMDPGGANLCVTHGDYRIDNMMYATDAGGYPLAVVDWQTVAWGIGTWDAAYFLGAGPVVAERREYEHALLRHYYDALISGGVSDYSWDQCWLDYRRGSLHGLLMTVVSSMIVDTDARGVAMFAAMAERHFSHALDLDAGEFLG